MFHQARLDPQLRGELLQAYSRYLRRIAEGMLSAKIRRRVAPSDIVQQTMAQADACFDQFRGATADQFKAWLAQIHRRNVIAENEKHRAVKRNVGRERSAFFHQNALGSSSSWAAADPQAPQPTASAEFMAQERARQLAALLGTLPRAQRVAVGMRYLQGRSVADIARALKKTEDAAAGLIKRGLHAMRRKWKEVQGDGSA